MFVKRIGFVSKRFDAKTFGNLKNVELVDSVT